MGRRIKKPPVTPEQRRGWFTRYLEGGETLHQIAIKDGYDIRTVKKQVERAQDEQDLRESRLRVIQHAVEKHHGTLCSFATQIDTSVEKRNRTTSLREERMWSALRQHLPRSPIWKSLDRWDRILQRLVDLEQESRDKIEEQLRSDELVKSLSPETIDGVVGGLATGLAFQMTNWSRGWAGILKSSRRVEEAGEGLVTFFYGFASTGTIKPDEVPSIQEIIDKYEELIVTWEQYTEMKRLNTELVKLQTSLRDELAIIALRGVVRGSCKYCPV